MTSPTYVRVTITTERRNVEMLLPAYRQVAELMPEILQICGTSSTHHTPQALTLTPVGSATLRAHQSLNDAGVGNGAVLALDRRDEAVPRPVIYDLAEETESMEVPATSVLSVNLDRLVTTAVFVLFGLIGLVIATEVFDIPQPAWWSLGIAGAALVLLAVIPVRLFSWDAEFIVFSAAALGLAYYWGLPDFLWSEWVVPVWLLAVLICWLAARRLWKSLLATGLAAAALVVLWWGSWQLFASHQQVVAVAGIGTVVLLGLAPRLALATSGMNRLDDDVAQGDRPSVPQAEAAFIRAHAGLAAAVILCAVSVTLAVHGLLDGGFTRWTLPLAILLVVLTALRARSMPLAIERAALLASAAASSLFILLALTDHLPSWLLLTIPVVLALLPVLLRVITVSAHHRAQLRIYARRLEGLATLALLPLLIGLFGIYSQLTNTFQD